jgi:geranylgeranyl diphosphate synthase type 3
MLRRGRPAAYKIWGVGQTINSASYALHSTLLEIEKLPNKDCTSVIISMVSRSSDRDAADLVAGGIVDAALGQALDLHTTHVVECPTEDEYLIMIQHSKSD